MTEQSTLSCRFCTRPLNRTFVDLGMSPLCQSHLGPDELERGEEFYPLHVFVCEGCLLVQLHEYVRPEAIFTEYAYFSSYVDTLLRYAEEYVEEVVPRFRLNSRSTVVEVASNDGYLLQYFAKKDIPVLGIEPAGNVAEAAESKGIPTRIRFFGVRTAQELVDEGVTADLLLGNNVLPHVPDLHDFVGGLKILLAPGGTVTIDFQHLMRMVEGNQFDTIYQEHFSYLSLAVVVRLFAHHGLTVFDVAELGTHGGSLRIFATHAERGVEPGSRVADVLAEEERRGMNELAYYAKFDERVKETKRGLLEFLIAAKRDGKSIVGYGAAGKTNTLLNYCGIRTDFIDYTVDRNPYKQGKFLPGTHIPILSPDRIRETRPDYLFVGPWNLVDEIMEQTSYIREWGGQWLIPIPEVRVVR
ncbi:class I SAM-dependent methyltransferase [Mycobacterium sp. 155]|uniref:class I SAM-dependent methyltransferase n=1 Tax=Mycobacterium sp. 155 TaxID=1157943 RepID=UPI000477CD38|nr:class I SAM-dependent methyltransferase [Mycobacterium sp. 155]